MPDIRHGDALIPQDDCGHPEITTQRNELYQETTYRCGQCGKKIGIPDRTMVGGDWSDVINIFLITFGPHWADWFAEHI